MVSGVGIESLDTCGAQDLIHTAYHHHVWCKSHLYKELCGVRPARGSERVSKHSITQVRGDCRHIRVLNEPESEGVEGSMGGRVRRVGAEPITDGGAVKEVGIKARLEDCSRRCEVGSDVCMP